MKIKRYVADDMAQACELIRQDLGSDALILSTQQLKPNPFSLKRRAQIEVVAGIGEPGDLSNDSAAMPGAGLAPSAFAHELVKRSAEAAAVAEISPAAASMAAEKYDPLIHRGRRQRGEQSLPDPRPALASAAAVAPATPPEPAMPQAVAAPLRSEAIERIERQLTELRTAVERIGRPKAPSLLLSLSEPVREVHARLQDQDVPQDVADALVTELRKSLAQTGISDEVAISRAASDALVRGMRSFNRPFAHSGRVTVTFMVGPTGSGKSATIAKLAARLKREGESVLLVNTDVRKAGAVQQFDAYANALGLPSETVYSPADLRTLLNRDHPYSVVLVDTAGASPNNEARLEELRALLATVRRKDVYLVLSATTRLADLLYAAERFEVAPLTGVVLTRRDEVVSAGHLLALMTSLHSPLALFGTGQDVLTDLQDADIRELADAVLGRDRHDQVVDPMMIALGA